MLLLQVTGSKAREIPGDDIVTTGNEETKAPSRRLTQLTIVVLEGGCSIEPLLYSTQMTDSILYFEVEL